jgi:4-diphosphocytidyl-2-C-methyl-D-erythritol kinase
MICFPNAKINVGLEVIRKREDNYHDLETIFYPISLSDILELNSSERTKITLTGLEIENDPENNLVMKAYRLLKEAFNLPPVEFHLHKLIPAGAGLGGGSSDAAFTLMSLNELFQLNIKKDKLLDYASTLGSDCAFFILNKPVFAEGKGNLFSEIKISLNGLTLVLIKPPFAVSTAQAYSSIIPHLPDFSLLESINKPVDTWENYVFNHFEKHVFQLFPQIGKIKDLLYESGALYASMSGSGSSVYGLFKDVPENLKDKFNGYFIWQGKCLI